MAEQWKDIEGYEGRYQVSDEGRVKSLAREFSQWNGHSMITVSLETRILHNRIEKQGYHRIGLRIDGKRRFFNVHRLVARAFVPNHDNLPEVNHKDENKSNNRADNLEWVSSKQNCNHATRNERIEAHTSRKRAIVQLTTSGDVVKNYKSISAASRETGISIASIGGVCRGEHHTAGGFRWQYAQPRITVINDGKTEKYTTEAQGIAIQQ